MKDANENMPEDRLDKDLEQLSRIGELREELQRSVGEPLAQGFHPETPLDVQEAFLKNVLAFETAPRVKTEELLAQRSGFRVRPLEELQDDDAVEEALWELIEVLAANRVFLMCTDHLSDRELYRLLLEEVLPDETVAMPEGSEWNRRVDMAEIPTPEYPDPSEIFLRFYADDDFREHWWKDFPEKPIPFRIEPSYDRDRFLPDGSD